MCLDNPDEIIAELQRLRDARAALAEWPPFPADSDDTDAQAFHPIKVTKAEGLRVLTQRIEDAEASIKQLGFTGPIKRVADGDSQLVINSR